MAKSIAVIGIYDLINPGMKRLIKKLENTMHHPNVKFYSCGSTDWEIYHKIIQLKKNKIIILDQFGNDDEDITTLNYITINDRILIVGINPIFFANKILPANLSSGLEQIIFQIKRLILKEVSLDSMLNL